MKLIGPRLKNWTNFNSPGRKSRHPQAPHLDFLWPSPVGVRQRPLGDSVLSGRYLGDLVGLEEGVEPGTDGWHANFSQDLEEKPPFCFPTGLVPLE